MSIHPIPSPASDPTDSLRWERLAEVRRLCAIHLREPSNVTDDGTTLSLVFTPDLTAGEAATLARLLAISGLVRVTPAEWATIEPDIANARAYLNVATPTLAQTAGMVKSLIRVLRVLLRD